jgi:hypothetical protein
MGCKFKKNGLCLFQDAPCKPKKPGCALLLKGSKKKEAKSLLKKKKGKAPKKKTKT